MNHRIFLKRRPSAKRRALACPNCGNPIAPHHAESIAFIAATHGTSTDCCLRCTLEEVELIESALYLDVPPTGAINRRSGKSIKWHGTRSGKRRLRLDPPIPTYHPER